MIQNKLIDFIPIECDCCVICKPKVQNIVKNLVFNQNANSCGIYVVYDLNINRSNEYHVYDNNLDGQLHFNCKSCNTLKLKNSEHNKSYLNEKNNLEQLRTFLMNDEETKSLFRDIRINLKYYCNTQKLTAEIINKILEVVRSRLIALGVSLTDNKTWNYKEIIQNGVIHVSEKITNDDIHNIIALKSNSTTFEDLDKVLMQKKSFF